MKILWLNAKFNFQYKILYASIGITTVVISFLIFAQQGNTNAVIQLKLNNFLPISLLNNIILVSVGIIPNLYIGAIVKS